MATRLRHPYGSFSVSPHLPFELRLDILDALTNNRHVTGLLHGSSYFFNSYDGASDPMLQSGTDAAGGKLNIAESFNNSERHVINTSDNYKCGGQCRDRRLRVGWWPRPGGTDGRWGTSGWYTRDTRIGFWGMREAGFTGIMNELYSMSSPHGNVYTDTFTASNPIPNFYVMTQLDCASLTGNNSHLTVNTPSAIANFISARVLANPSAYKNAAGRYIIGSFHAKKGTDSGINQAWLTSFFSAMEAAGAPAALLPFADGDWTTAYIDGSGVVVSNGLVPFARLGGTGGSWIGEWGADRPSIPGSSTRLTRIGHLRGVSTASQKLNFCFTPQLHNTRPRAGWFNECEGLALIKAHGDNIIANGIDGDHVHWVTFNDMAESHLCPTTGHQYVGMDIAAYYNYAFRTGARPTIVRDVIYGAHRLHAYDAMPGPAQIGFPAGHAWAGIWGSATVEANGSKKIRGKDATGKNIISMLAFCKEACTVRIVHPNHSTVLASHDVTAGEAAAGPYLLQYEGTLPAGKPYFQLIRDSQTLIDMQSDYRIRASLTRFQTPNYRMSGSGRRSLSKLATWHPHIEPVQLAADDGDVNPCDPRYGAS